MRLLRHVARLIGQTLVFGVATNRLWIVLAVLLGLAAAAIALSAQVAAPFVIYPFA